MILDKSLVLHSNHHVRFSPVKSSITLELRYGELGRSSGLRRLSWLAMHWGYGRSWYLTVSPRPATSYPFHNSEPEYPWRHEGRRARATDNGYTYISKSKGAVPYVSFKVLISNYTDCWTTSDVYHYRHWELERRWHIPQADVCVIIVIAILIAINHHRHLHHSMYHDSWINVLFQFIAAFK